MIIALDQSMKKIDELMWDYDVKLWQFRTPLTRYHSGNVPYILDNGAYSYDSFGEWKQNIGPSWLAMVEATRSIPGERCHFVNMVDRPGDWHITLALFRKYKSLIPMKSKRMITLQDGANIMSVPWNEIGGVFVGGSTKWKQSSQARKITRYARDNDYWVHVGRVNTWRRMDSWFGECDSIDGSGIARYEHMFDKAASYVKENQDKLQRRIPEWA